MAGFSGAVEDGARGVGIIISLVAAIAVGWLRHSFGLALVVFLVGYAIAAVWGHLAGERFMAQQLDDLKPDPDKKEPVSED